MQKVIAIITPLILAFIGGFLDIYSLMYRGGKFILLQTGNIIYIGRDLINGNYNEVLICLFIFLAFTIGLVIANIISFILKKKEKEYLLHIVLLSLIFILLIPNYFFSKTMEFDLSYLAVFMLGLIGGILLESFRFSYLAYTATMMTNNYKLFMHALINGILLKDKKERHKSYIYLLIIVSFICGVLLYTLFYKYDIITQQIIFIPQILTFILIVMEVIKIKKVGNTNEE